MRGRAPRWRTIVSGGSALLAIAAISVALFWGSIFESVLASQLELTPDSRSFHDWRAPTVPLFFEVFVFNWTNAERFPDELPNLVQLGPYRFREYRRHVNITWHANNGSIAYRTLRRWWFDPSSNGSLSDNITTLNVIAASAAYRSRNWDFISQNGLSMFLSMFNHQLSVSKTAGELLFDGYEDLLLDLAKSLPESSTGGAPPVDKFGWFYGRNNTVDTDGYMEVTTGADGSLPGQILKWNYEDHVPFYGGKCSELSGSAGEFLPHNLTADSKLTMFVPDLCRTVHMDYVGSGEYGGLSYHKYAISKRSFDNSSLSPSNSCFCNGECSWSGVMNVSACRFDSPAFISLPHFLHGDPQLRAMVAGMAPDPGKHSFYFAVEPRLGVPLDVAARFQLNFLIGPSEYIKLYKDVPTMLFPVFWVQQRVTVEERLLVELRIVRSILDWGCTFCVCVAIFFGVIVAITSCCTKKTESPKYIPPTDLTFEKPKDDAEIKLNPMRCDP